ncbi:hypothetical protein GCM10027419_41840 [Pandoraea terrae]
MVNILTGIFKETQRGIGNEEKASFGRDMGRKSAGQFDQRPGNGRDRFPAEGRQQNRRLDKGHAGGESI